MDVLVVVLAVFVLIIVFMIALRATVGERFDVKNSDILLALIPIAIWLVLTGKVKVIEFGGFKIEAAFIEASKTPIATQITKLPVEPVRMDPKGGIGELPRFMRSKTEALVFQLRHGGYYGPAIHEYLSQLTKLPFFKYIVINQPDGTFAGLANAHEVFSAFSADGERYDQLARWLNESDLTSLARLPGFILAKDAVQDNTDKRTALERLEALHVEALPVMNQERRLAGVIERSRVVASLILEVARKVE